MFLIQMPQGNREYYTIATKFKKREEAEETLLELLSDYPGGDYENAIVVQVVAQARSKASIKRTRFDLWEEEE